MALTIGLVEAKNNFSKVTSEINSMGETVTVLKNNRPWVYISPAAPPREDSKAGDFMDIAVDFMDEYSDVFKELARCE